MVEEERAPQSEELSQTKEYQQALCVISRLRPHGQSCTRADMHHQVVTLVYEAGRLPKLGALSGPGPEDVGSSQRKKPFDTVSKELLAMCLALWALNVWVGFFCLFLCYLFLLL